MIKAIPHIIFCTQDEVDSYRKLNPVAVVIDKDTADEKIEMNLGIFSTGASPILIVTERLCTGWCCSIPAHTTFSPDFPKDGPIRMQAEERAPFDIEHYAC